MDIEEIIELTKEGEMDYAPVPPSMRSDSERIIKLEDILPKLKPFSVRKPVAFIVGSMAVHGKSNNDIDIVVRGEDWSEDQKMAFDFRLYRMFADILGVPYDEIANIVSIHYSNEGPFTAYIPIYEDTMIPIHNPSKINMSTSFNMLGKLQFVKKGKDNRRIIAGYASVTIVDDEGQYIPLEALKEGLHTLLDDPAYSNLMLVHKNIQVGKIIKEYGDLKTHVDDKGLFVVAEIRDDLKAADAAWQEILNGNMNGFSIAGEILSSHQECDDKSCIEVIDKINIFEVSLCHNPVNKESGFVIVSKSKMSDDVCDMLKEMEDIMVRKKKLSKEVETKDVETLEASEEEEIETEEKSGCDECEETEEEKSMEEEEETEEEEEEKSESAKDINAVIEELQRKINALEKIISEKSEYTDFIKECMKEGKTMEECAKEWKESQSSAAKGGLVDVIKEKIDALLKKDKITKNDLQELKDMIDKLKGGKYPYPYPYPSKYPYPTKYPYPSKYPYPKKGDKEPDWYSMVVDAIDELYETVKAEDKEPHELDSEESKTIDEIKLAIKARDDAIKGYEEKIAELENRLKKLESVEEEQKTTTESEEEILRDTGVIINRGVIYKAED